MNNIFESKQKNLYSDLKNNECNLITKNNIYKFNFFGNKSIDVISDFLTIFNDRIVFDESNKSQKITSITLFSDNLENIINKNTFDKFKILLYFSPQNKYNKIQEIIKNYNHLIIIAVDQNFILENILNDKIPLFITLLFNKKEDKDPILMQKKIPINLENSFFYAKSEYTSFNLSKNKSFFFNFIKNNSIIIINLGLINNIYSYYEKKKINIYIFTTEHFIQEYDKILKLSNKIIFSDSFYHPNILYKKYSNVIDVIGKIKAKILFCGSSMNFLAIHFQYSILYNKYNLLLGNYFIKKSKIHIFQKEIYSYFLIENNQKNKNFIPKKIILLSSNTQIIASYRCSIKKNNKIFGAIDFDFFIENESSFF